MFKKWGKSFIRPLKRLRWAGSARSLRLAGAGFDRLLETEDLPLKGICYSPKLGEAGLEEQKNPPLPSVPMPS